MSFVIVVISCQWSIPLAIYSRVPTPTGLIWITTPCIITWKREWSNNIRSRYYHCI